MEAKTDNEMNGCVILWKVVNVNHCWLKRGEEIVSPTFTAKAIQSTKWSLSFKPLGRQSEVGILLHRKYDCNGPDEIKVIYKLVILHKDGSSLVEKKLGETFLKGEHGWSLFVDRTTIFGSQKEVFLPNDTLTLQCVLWNKDEAPLKLEELYAQTVWNVKRRRFVWNIAKFSTFNPDFRNKFKDDLIEFDFLFNEGLDFEIKLAMDIISFDKSIKYFLLKISVINSKRKKQHYGNFEYFEYDLNWKKLPKTLSTRMLLENKSRYLPNDILSLDCECVYSTGTISDQFCINGLSNGYQMEIPEKILSLNQSLKYTSPDVREISLKFPMSSSLNTEEN